ncbi:hypothetical protein HNQ07_000645 [Deinococcus metalli]|uniref:Uncharacterized protein n=1 Tax=Deinococcus metalli TaxID=1141878 RepID=A0A7W8NMZ6_9DEIO|nr:hypothetical protein [Deinococcus metalli]MBB5375201.1 hypothetical protein [Deinococcus metalli]GHF31013.1 hypothetical protein GCM10017781_03960 [Deinococcus metalli]
MPTPDPPTPPATGGTEYVLRIEWARDRPPTCHVARRHDGEIEWLEFREPDALLRHLWLILDGGPGLR